MLLSMRMSHLRRLTPARKASLRDQAQLLNRLARRVGMVIVKVIQPLLLLEEEATRITGLLPNLSMKSLVAARIRQSSACLLVSYQLETSKFA